MKIRWTCGMSVGPSRWYWSGDWCFGPDECPGEGEIEVSPEDWENLEFPMECAECGQELDPFCAHFEAPDGTTSQDIYDRLYG